MDASNQYQYVGTELDIFAHATTWKRYWASRLIQWVRGNVLEIGAGVGANTTRLYNTHVERWLCVEPDPSLTNKLRAQVGQLSGCKVLNGTLSDVPRGEDFDAILYVDVLEHIEDDAEEASRAAVRLRRGGHLVVLGPAHNYLFSPFDAALNHYRRYDKRMLRAISPAGCRLVSMFYLDSVGVFASLANKAMLRQAHPTHQQIQLWDKWMIPVSRVLDPLLGYHVGKTIVAVWQRT